MPNCPRCRQISRPDARYCYSCGLSLSPGIDGTFSAGKIRHPHALQPAGQMTPVEAAVDLYYRWESALNGRPLIGTEGARVQLFNAGYGLQDGLFVITAHGESGELCAVERSVTLLPHGATVSLELPSYELSEPLQSLTLRLLRAEFAPEAPQAHPA